MGKLKEGYKKIEKGTIDGYKKIEETVVGGYKKIEDKFVDKFLRNDDETIYFLCSLSHVRCPLYVLLQ